MRYAIYLFVKSRHFIQLCGFIISILSTENSPGVWYSLALNVLRKLSEDLCGLLCPQPASLEKLKGKNGAFQIRHCRLWSPVKEICWLSATNHSYKKKKKNLYHVIRKSSLTLRGDLCIENRLCVFFCYLNDLVLPEIIKTEKKKGTGEFFFFSLIFESSRLALIDRLTNLGMCVF